MVPFAADQLAAGPPAPGVDEGVYHPGMPAGWQPPDWFDYEFGNPADADQGAAFLADAQNMPRVLDDARQLCDGLGVDERARAFLLQQPGVVILAV
eukprot:15467132-Alexandrium_andersonii.AAC.1